MCQIIWPLFFQAILTRILRLKKVEQNFGYMKPKPIPPYTFAPEQPISSPVKRDVYGPNPENLTVAFRFPGASTRDARLLDLMGSMLTNGKAGLFDLDLVKNRNCLAPAPAVIP
jgi:hypothetical protein